MFCPNDKMDKLKLKLKNATRLKLSKERRLIHKRNEEQSLSEEICTIKYEIENLKEKLEDLTDSISETTHEISQLEGVKAAMKSQTDILIHNLRGHKRDFEEKIDKERSLLEVRNRQLLAREVEAQELEQKRQKELSEMDERQGREAAAIEEECNAIEMDCAVLMKRNSAIKLKLRRKLVETENARRELMKKSHIHDK